MPAGTSEAEFSVDDRTYRHFEEPGVLDITLEVPIHTTSSLDFKPVALSFNFRETEVGTEEGPSSIDRFIFEGNYGTAMEEQRGQLVFNRDNHTGRITFSTDLPDHIRGDALRILNDGQTVSEVVDQISLDLNTRTQFLSH